MHTPTSQLLKLEGWDRDVHAASARRHRSCRSGGLAAAVRRDRSVLRLRARARRAAPLLSVAAAERPITPSGMTSRQPSAHARPRRARSFGVSLPVDGRRFSVRRPGLRLRCWCRAPTRGRVGGTRGDRGDVTAVSPSNVQVEPPAGFSRATGGRAVGARPPGSDLATELHGGVPELGVARAPVVWPLL
jgi:hypothetical protein